MVILTDVQMSFLKSSQQLTQDKKNEKKKCFLPVQHHHGEVQMLENNRYNNVSRVHKSTISITMLSLLPAERKS